MCYGPCSSLVVVNAAFEGTDRHIVTFGVNLSGAEGVEPRAMGHSLRWRAKGATQRRFFCLPTPRPERWSFRGILDRCCTDMFFA